MPSVGKRDSMSVYPPRQIAATLGSYRSKPFTQAVRCFAKLLEPATAYMSSQITKHEWCFLADAVEGREDGFDPAGATPGEHLAQMVDRAIEFEVGLARLGRGGAKAAASLAARLRELDYLCAWAVIYTLQYRAHLASLGEIARDATAGGCWWTLGHRQATAAKTG